MKKKALIDCGHCLTGYDTGARGCGYKEEVLTRQIGKKVKELLEKKDYEVVIISPDSSSSLSESLANRANKANSIGGDIYVSIHLNAFNGNAYGTEIYTYKGVKLTEANRVLNNITSLGYYNRGIKDGSNLYVVRNTTMPSMLIECCFIDNAKDMERFDVDKMAKAIAEGVCGETIKEEPVESKPTPSVNNNSCNGKYGIVTGDGVRLRKGASLNSAVLGFANKGDKFKIGNKVGDWYSIYWGDHGAFISASYFQVDNGEVKGDSWIRRLQEECNRQGFSKQKVDGLAGNNTLNGCPMVRRGATGNITKLLQEKLNSLGYSTNGCDGIFGQGTEQAVRKYQSNKGLSADGIVGSNTWRKLLGL